MAQLRLSQLPLPRAETALGEAALVIDPAVDVAELAAQIHQWLGESDIESPDRRRLLELARQALDAGRDRLPDLRWGGHCLRVWNGWVVRVKEPGEGTVFPDEVVVGEEAVGPWGHLSWEPIEGNPAFPVGMRLRCAVSGELENLALLNRPQKATKKWLQELRIPPWWRRHLLVLYSEKHPVWLLPVGPLSGAEAFSEQAAQPGLRPVWRLSLSV